MNLTQLFTYVPPVIAIAALIIKWRGMGEYLPAGLFASWFANFVCHSAMIFNFWSFSWDFEEAIINCILVPVAVMFWLRYFPRGKISLLFWNLLWTIPLTGLECISERFSNVIQYHHGYDCYYSLLLWFISWFVWYGFHQWFHKETC
jgi:hypothetical protein